MKELLEGRLFSCLGSVVCSPILWISLTLDGLGDGQCLGNRFRTVFMLLSFENILDRKDVFALRSSAFVVRTGAMRLISHLDYIAPFSDLGRNGLSAVFFLKDSGFCRYFESA